MLFDARLLVSLCGLLALTASVHAHHSSSTYNLEQTVTIEGTVTRVQWVNPHVFIFMDQITESGQILNWAVEGVNPAGLRRVGWERDTLKMGDVITVTGSPSKNMTTPAIYPNTIAQGGTTLFDEQEFFAGTFTLQESETGSTSLAGVWQIPLNPAVIIPRELEMDFQPGIGLHELTDFGLQALNQFDELTMNPALNCVEITAPLIMHFGGNKQITIEDNQIRILSEYDGGERIIYMTEEAIGSIEHSNQGHSVGKWEGSSLTIETTHFAENNFGNGFGLPSSTQKHLQERLTLSDDGKSVSYQFTLTDPIYLASPMSLESQWVYQPDYEVVIDDCNLESARRFLQN